MANVATKPNPPQNSVVRVGRYDQVTSIMIALILVFVLAVVGLSTMVVSRSTKIDVLKDTVPIEFTEDPGGSPDGNTTDPSQAGSGPADDGAAVQADISADEVEKAPRDDSQADAVSSESIDQVSQMEPNLIASAEASKNPNAKGGSGGDGTGDKVLIGSGKGKGGGFPREERWLIRYADTASLEEYARQLDYFGIELGAVVGSELVYISKMSLSNPEVRRAKGGGGEKRLYFTWQGGSRKAADLALFRKAGVTNIGDGMILQFYPKNTENLLAKIEHDKEGLKYNQIRRTYFAVRKPEGGSGYEFYVTRQVPIR